MAHVHGHHSLSGCETTGGGRECEPNAAVKGHGLDVSRWKLHRLEEAGSSLIRAELFA